MPEETFNRDSAAREHSEIIRAVEQIRDGLSNDVINYYYSGPSSEDEQREKRDGMRRYLRVAQRQIEELLNGKLY